MRDRPPGLAESDLISALAAGWTIETRSLDYLPVGAGSYHWSAVDRSGDTWFVKVDKTGFDDLRRSMETALTLHRDAGLAFVVAPVPAVDGAVLRRLGHRYALAVFPMIEGVAGEFGPHPDADLPEMTALLTALHRATDTVAHLAPRDDLRLPGRAGLLEALADLDRPWTSGPHAEPARHLLGRHQDRIRRRLADFDRLAHLVGETAADWVITHGEPHPGNVLRTSGGLRLIDWTTARIAPPARDLWMLTPAFAGLTTGSAGLTTGSAGLPSGIAFHRVRWVLADVAAFTADLRAPHGDGADAAAALRYLTAYLAKPRRSPAAGRSE
ncbi:hypothetical protein Ait01nite_040500 [Actinoplanes italicus]|uniref:Spectinomycin phosphotransferase n=1 Tax=Actinoplanes italicus TaxID=113567 RepID=A0A2T0K2R5_9ACTN|nr:aminoglycoside phosphotransferase family protein [Actinoplanes italicus]PRX16863.1 spectinomycin phosphotransferase [Actinoplanes italicus]GIE31005.1 hypothetical protein Ait01nite_040500 [Actinoplanes italicus]